MVGGCKEAVFSIQGATGTVLADLGNSWRDGKLTVQESGLFYHLGSSTFRGVQGPSLVVEPLLMAPLTFYLDAMMLNQASSGPRLCSTVPPW